MSYLSSLPSELILRLYILLPLLDGRSLSLTCRQMHSYIENDGYCRLILKLRAPYSQEFLDACASGHYSDAWKRLLMLREAISSMRPFVTAVVAVASEWIYEHGVLVYSNPGVLRIRNLHSSARTELVVHERELLEPVLSSLFRSHISPITASQFTPLYYSNGFVSCLCSFEWYNISHGSSVRSALVVIKEKENGPLFARELLYTDRLFVRNTDKFLFLGVCRTFGSHLFWELRGFNLETQDELKGRLHIPCCVGPISCFEILDGWFCGVFIDPVCNPGYITFCFRANERGFENITRKILRRTCSLYDAKEGSQSQLRIFRDETTGKINILEISYNAERQRRGYYITPFCLLGDEFCAGEEANDQETGATVQGTELEDAKHAEEGRIDCCGGGKSVAFVRRETTVTSMNYFAHSFYPSCRAFVNLAGTYSGKAWGLNLIYLQGGPLKKLRTRDSDSDLSPSQIAQASLVEVLKPLEYVEFVHGKYDDRSMVCAAGPSEHSPKMLVLVSFDPKVRL